MVQSDTERIDRDLRRQGRLGYVKLGLGFIEQQRNMGSGENFHNQRNKKKGGKRKKKISGQTVKTNI